MKKFILPLIFIFLSSLAFSQNTCASAIALTQASIPYTSGALTTCGTGNDYGVGSAPCSTTYGGGEDYVFSLTITSSPVTYSFSIGGAGTWKICQIYTGCPSPVGSPNNCVGNITANPSGTGNITFPSNGTYYIVMDTWPLPACGAFTLGIYPMPTCPGSLGPVTAVASLPYASGAGTSCGTGNNIIGSSVPSLCGSASYYTGEDAIWTFTPTTNGYVNINLTSTGTWTGLMLYNGCPFSSTATCAGQVQSSTGTKALSACVTAGSVYYLIMDSFAAPACNPYTSLTISAPTASATTNDFCQTPTPLSAGGTFTGSTTGMTADQPGNFSSVFCGSTENNQWFSFVASATTHTFGFTGIGGASCPYGIQGQAFQVATTPTPCAACTSFTNKTSPCYNPGTTANGTLTATSLTIGQTYYLVVDGNAGSACTFNINGWSIPVLPVDLVYFNGIGLDEKTNKLEWMVAMESNFDYYQIQRSVDGKNFSDLDKVFASGPNNVEKTYNYYDKSFAQSVNYYRLKIVDKDATFRYSALAAINSDKNTKFKVNKIFPNPANTDIYMSVDIPTDTEIEYQILDVTGRVVAQNKQSVSMGTTVLSVNLEKFSKGIYYLKFDCNNETKVEKFSLQ